MLGLGLGALAPIRESARVVDAETPFRSEAQSFVRKLESLTDLTADAKAAVLELKMTTRSIAADQDVVSIGEVPTESCFILEGYAFRYKVLSDGGRQIMSLHMAGDLPDLQSLHVVRLDYSLATLVAFLPHTDLHELMRRHESIWIALWRDSLIDAAIFREWLISASRRTAHQRVSHRFCEVAVRTRAVGLNTGDTYPWPFTQSEFADAVGLTDVHVNRVLRDMRRDGLINVGRGTFTVLDWPGLKALAQFDPTYLRLEPRPPT